MQIHEDPCISISLNTHRTHPDNQQDAILLKKLLREAEQELEKGYGKSASAPYVEKLRAIPDSLNMSYNLDSMHIFLSESTEKILRLPIPSSQDNVHIDSRFDLKPLIKAMNRTEDYLILLLSEGGTALYEALNDGIIREIEMHGFPFEENPWYLPRAVERSDAKRVDNQSREYMNRIDKALNKVHHDLGLSCIVVSTSDNFHMLQQVADKPSVYVGHVDKNYRERAPHQLAESAWEVVKKLLSERRKAAVEEMKKAQGQSKVLTDLGEIYRAAREGRGELLLAGTSFAQAVKKLDEHSIEIINGEAEAASENHIKDITPELALEVYSKKGRVIFAEDEELNGFGKIALKIRH